MVNLTYFVFMNKFLKGLDLTLPPGWIDVTDLEDDSELAAFAYRNYPQDEMMLHVSVDSCENLDTVPLVADIVAYGRNDMLEKDSIIQYEESGLCDYGEYAMFQAKERVFKHVEIWVLGDGRHFVNVTFICRVTPGRTELKAVRNAIKTIRKGKTS